jgi:DNA polymerase-1
VDKKYGMDKGRSYAKTLNFGLIYGMQPKTLARELKLPEADAATMYNQFFNAYKGVRELINGTGEAMMKRGFVRSLSGRRMYFTKDIFDYRMGNLDEYQLEASKRTAFNCIIQGSAADLMKLIMNGIQECFDSDPKTYGNAQILFQVHDEIIVECEDYAFDTVKDTVTYYMENTAPNLRVPILADVKGGKESWGDYH